MPNGFNNKHPLNAARHPVMATIATANFDVVIAAYKSALGYQLVESGHLSIDMANHWGLPDLGGARLTLLQPQSGVPVFLRFLEIEPTEPSPPSCGWFALELCVKDVEALYETLIAGREFIPFAEPKPMAFTDRVYPMQCKGPAGEILYLNQVRGNLPDIDLPLANSFVDHIFIIILSAPDMDAANAFYCDLLDMSVNERHEIAYKTINRVHGLPLDTRHKLSTLGGPRHVGLEIDQYPSAANFVEPGSEATVDEGILMVSFATSSLTTLPESVSALPKSFQASPYNGAASVVFRGPAKERLEIIEITVEK